jgi:2-octaprenyl-6-methoxyphenol hydroxylase
VGIERRAAEGDAVTAGVGAGADGTGSAVKGIVRRHHDYRQTALIAKVWRAADHDNVAYERFTPQGAMALLPEGDHYALIWTMTPERAAQLTCQADHEFLANLVQTFGSRAGALTRIEDRRAFPLVLEYALNIIGRRCVVLGNAAQTLHPVAGQGFNLGLRDAYELAQVVLDASPEHIGEPRMLGRYAATRHRDRTAGIAFTHGLVGAFGNDLPLLRWPRGLALTLLDALPPAKRAFTRTMLFGV